MIKRNPVLSPQVTSPSKATNPLWLLLIALAVFGLGLLNMPTAQAQTATPPGAAFGPREVGSTANQTVNFKNNSTTISLTVISIGFTGFNPNISFDASACPPPSTPLPPSGSCNIVITYKPTAVGAAANTLRVTYNSAGANATTDIAVSGTGVLPAPSVAPTSLDFGNQEPTTTSLFRLVTFKNNAASVPLTITGFFTNGDPSAFVLGTSTCPAATATLAPGASCTVQVAFSPTSVGLFTDILRFNSSGGGSNFTTDAALSGTGAVPAPSLAPAALDFGNVELYTASSKLVTFKNNAVTQPITLTSLTTLGATTDFNVSNPGGSCPPAGGSLAAGASCTVQLQLIPTTAGPKTGTFRLVSTAGGGVNFTNDVALSGAGFEAPPTVSPATLDFGPVEAGKSSTLNLVYKNTSGVYGINAANFTITPGNPAQAGSFSQTNNCTNPVNPGATCTIQVKFSPAQAGSYSATLTIVSNLIIGGNSDLKAAAPYGQFTTNVTLKGQGVVTPTTKPHQSQIGGTVLVNSVPTAGFKVRLEGGSGGVQITEPDGRYNFTGLEAGLYVVRVIEYDPALFAPVGQDYSNRTLSGTDVESAVNFQFQALTPPATTAPPVTTAPPTTPPPATTAPAGFNPQIKITPASGPAGTIVQVQGTGWNPKAPDGSPNQVTVVLDTQTATTSALQGSAQNAPLGTLGTFTVGADGTFQGQATLPTTLSAQSFFLIGTDKSGGKAQAPFQIEPTAQCPSVSAGEKLRVATKTVKVSDTKFLECIQVVAGSEAVNLNDTVILQLPTGTSVLVNSNSLGTVTVNSNVVRWGGFSLAAGQSATLVLSLTVPPNGTLDGSSILISGRFSRGQAFQQRISGLPPLTEIDVPAQGGGGGGSGSGTTAPIPSGAPSTGTGISGDSELNWIALLLVLLVLASAATTVGLVSRVRRR